MRSVFFGEEASTLWTREKVMSQLGDRYQHRVCDIQDANAIKDLFAEKQGGIAGVIHTAAQPSHDWAVKDPQIDFSIKVHNDYQQAGGEDQVFQAETALLQSKNQQVITYTVHNEAVALYGKFASALITLWNQSRYLELCKFFKRNRPNVVHVHNTLPLISPAIYYAAKAPKTQICFTLHNYRLLCLKALFLRNDVVCEDCMGRFVAWPWVRYS
jgi:hypothetical protein